MFGGGTLATVRSFAIAVPGQQAAVPQAVLSLSEHLHCIPHSAVMAAAVTLLLWWWRRALWIPLLGWWSHIVIDVFTHSADYYAVPVLYPFTMRGFDGRAWSSAPSNGSTKERNQASSGAVRIAPHTSFSVWPG